MLRTKKKHLEFLLLSLFVLFFVITIYAHVFPYFNSNLPKINNPAYPNHDIENDEFIESFAEIDNIDAANTFIKSYYDGSSYSLPYNIEDFARKSFKHGLQEYTFQDNWFLWVLNKYISVPIFKKNISGYLNPDEILSKPFAWCSQSALVIQELLSTNGFEYSSVLFDSPEGGHFATAVLMDDKWYYLDSDVEYQRTGKLFELEKIVSNKYKLVDEIFKTRPEVINIIKYSNKNSFTQIVYKNEYPAKLGSLLISLTNLISNFGWLLLLALYFYLRKVT